MNPPLCRLDDPRCADGLAETYRILRERRIYVHPTHGLMSVNMETGMEARLMLNGVAAPIEWPNQPPPAEASV